MTIGIAAICDSGNTIVMAADREFSVGMTSGESKVGKHNNFGMNWYVAYAANNVPNAFEVIMTARPLVLKLPDKVWHDVIPAIERGYQKVRNAKAAALYLSSWGETSDGFHASGKDRIPPNDYTEIRNRLMAYNLDADLLIAGFDDTARIFTVKNPGIAQDQTGLGFWAIGSGAPAAISSLFARKCSFHCHLEEVLYLVYEAKLQAEKASNVGTETDLFVICKDCGPIRIPDGDQDNTLKSIWEDLRPRDIEQKHLLKVGTLPQVQVLKRQLNINFNKYPKIFNEMNVPSVGQSS
jgi:hypothetical protein